MAAKKSFTEKLQKEKTTPNTIRYKNEDDTGDVPYVYIKNTGVKKLGSPAAISITVTAEPSK